MSAVELPVEVGSVGVEHAETHLPWQAVVDRARSHALLALIGVVQVAWLGGFAYSAYLFLR